MVNTDHLFLTNEALGHDDLRATALLGDLIALEAASRVLAASVIEPRSADYKGVPAYTTHFMEYSGLMALSLVGMGYDFRFYADQRYSNDDTLAPVIEIAATAEGRQIYEAVAEAADESTLSQGLLILNAPLAYYSPEAFEESVEGTAGLLARGAIRNARPVAERLAMTSLLIDVRYKLLSKSDIYQHTILYGRLRTANCAPLGYEEMDGLMTKIIKNILEANSDIPRPMPDPGRPIPPRPGTRAGRYGQ